MSGTGNFAAIRNLHAMATGFVHFAEMSFGEAVETEKKMLGLRFEIGARTGDQRADVVRMIVVGRDDLEFHPGSDFFRVRANSLNSGFVARHCVVGKKRDYQELVHICVREIQESMFDRWILVTHCEFDRPIDPILQRIANLFAAHD